MPTTQTQQEKVSTPPAARPDAVAPLRIPAPFKAPNVAHKTPPKNSLWPYAAALLVVFAAGVVLLNSGGTPEVAPTETAVAQRAPLAGVLHEIGALEALTETPVLSPINGEIVWKIDDGAFVDAGEPVVRFDSTQLEEDIVNSEQTLQDKDAGVKRAEAQIESTRERYKCLIRQNEITVEMAKLDHDDTYSFPHPQDRLDTDLSYKSAELDVQSAEIDLSYDEDLFKRGFISDFNRKAQALVVATKRVTLEKNRLIKQNNDLGCTPDQKRTADLAVKDAEKVLQVSKFNCDADLKVQTAALTLAKIQQENSERDLARKKKVFDQATVRAPVRGRVSFIDVYKGPGKSNTPVQIGEQRAQGQDLCVMCDTSALRCRVLVCEADIKRVAEGQTATIKLRAFPTTPLKAKVTKVALVAQDKNLALSGLAARRSGEAFVNVIEVKLDFDGVPAAEMRKMRIGYTADVMIDTANAPDALQIPWTAVNYDKTGAPYAEVQTANGALEHRTLKLGCFDCNRVQILDGVVQGERVRVSY